MTTYSARHADVSTRSRRSDRRRRIAVLVPAINEEANIGATIESIMMQERAPDRIIIIPNNCVDRTADVARTYPVEVIELPDNPDRKSGALNRGLDVALPDLDPEDLILCMDSDTVLTPSLLKNAIRHFDDDPGLGALSSNHLVMRHDNIIELLQAMEYERDRRYIGRKKGKVGCMTGMAAVFRVITLLEVREKYGSVYDPHNVTEDWKLTLAIKDLGWSTIRPQDCEVSTVPVSTVLGLFHQRDRWAQGYLQTLCEFGLTRLTAVLWLRQIGMMWSIAVRFLYFIMLGVLISDHRPLLAWWMLPVFLIFTADTVFTVRKVSVKAMMVAAIFPIEVAYTWAITAAIFSGYIKHLTGASSQWNRVRR